MEDKVREYLERLDKWVEAQKRTLEAVDEILGKLGEMDRLELILNARIIFQNITVTAKAFENWLQDYLVLSHISSEEAEKVLKKAAYILKELVRLDIEHTIHVKERIEESLSTGRMPPIIKFARQPERDREEAGERGLLSM